MAPSPTPTRLPPPTTSEGCEGTGRPRPPRSWGGSTGPGHVPRRRSAPRHGQREPDGSGAAGFARMTELEEQRFGHECPPPYPFFLPHGPTPSPPAWLCAPCSVLRAGGWARILPALAPRGLIVLFVVLFYIIYIYIFRGWRCQALRLGSAGLRGAWQWCIYRISQ